MPSERDALLASAKTFCDAVSQQTDAETILTHFSQTHQVSVFEHGDPSLAPFLGRSFIGKEGVKVYFDLISSVLSYGPMEFSGFAVDTELKKVALKGKARFTWLSTKESWDETFAYILDFDQDGLVTDYQIWADTGAAYLASKGELEHVRGSS
ncbi:hypothetical protein DL96DRAFT_811654 [Flagelloscypha sp. PMI_526]|nr:hypothetical protein DL96DRAFT_811654 [Flagelloscypha sp. PMI_526]